MRNFLVIFVAFSLFSQNAVAASCIADPGPNVVCSSCTTLDQFAFYGASAIHGASRRSNIVVTGGGSRVYVNTGLAWERYTGSVTVIGTFGFDISLPSFTHTQVTAYDSTGRARGGLPNNGKYPFSALSDKCKEIKAAQQKVTQSFDWRNIDVGEIFVGGELNLATRPVPNYGSGVGPNYAFPYPGLCIGVRDNSGTLCYR